MFILLSVFDEMPLPVLPIKRLIYKD